MFVKRNLLKWKYLISTSPLKNVLFLAPECKLSHDQSVMQDKAKYPLIASPQNLCLKSISLPCTKKIIVTFAA